MSSGWCCCRLFLAESLQLWDYFLLLFYKLNKNQRHRLFAWNCAPARVLGFCLRHLWRAKLDREV